MRPFLAFLLLWVEIAFLKTLNFDFTLLLALLNLLLLSLFLPFEVVHCHTFSHGIVFGPLLHLLNLPSPHLLLILLVLLFGCTTLLDLQTSPLLFVILRLLLFHSILVLHLLWQVALWSAFLFFHLLLVAFA